MIDDRELENSFRLGIEIVPTLVRMQDGREIGRTFGWHRGDWETLSGHSDLGPGLPDHKPGCGSRSIEPGVEERLSVRFGDVSFGSRKIDVDVGMDEIEACFDRGWSDGLPVVPPTEVRVLRMLNGTRRKADEVLGPVPPALSPCTVEKAAVNAVMAGCKPEYFPVVLAALEAVLEPAFAMHGVLATTDFASPIVIVSGPIAKRIGMNYGCNALGQGTRANATIGAHRSARDSKHRRRIAGGVDRATLGQPGKFTYCIAEDVSDEGWDSLSVERGFSKDTSTVTMFAGGGVHGIWGRGGPQARGHCRANRTLATPPRLSRYARARARIGHARVLSHLQRARLGTRTHQVRPNRGKSVYDL